MSADPPVPGPDPPPAAMEGLRFCAAGPDDAADLLALKSDLDRQTSFMLLEPGERAESSRMSPPPISAAWLARSTRS